MIGKKRKNDDDLIVDLEDFENYGLVDDEEYEEDDSGNAQIAQKKPKKSNNENVKKTTEDSEESDEEYDDEEYEEYEEVDDTDDDEEYEIVDDTDDDEEYEIVDDEDDEEYEEVDDTDDEEYEEVDDTDDEEYEEVDDTDDDEEYEIVDDDDDEEYEEVDDTDDEEYEEVDDTDDDEEYEIVDDEDDEEYEEVDDTDDDEEYEIVDDEDDEEYEEVDDTDDEEYEEADDTDDDEEYEIVDDDDDEEYDEADNTEDEEYEEADDAEDEEYEEVDDTEDEEYEEVDDADDDEEYEEVDDAEDEEYEEVDDAEDEEYEEVDDTDDEEYEETNDTEDHSIDEEINDDIEEETEDEETDDTEDSEDDEEYEEVDDTEEDDEDEDEEDEENESLYPDELVDLELESVYIGLLFNNPKAISRFYFLYDDCRFSDNELSNLYRIIIFRDGEAYAPAVAKEKFQLPRETPKTYDLKYKTRKLAASKDYNLEKVYTDLKKLFILKKNYVIAPTSKIQEEILKILDYDLYDDMTVEEVESALEQITVTTGLSRAVLNEDATKFLLSGDNELSNGISLPFPTLTTVFKGIRKGETMTYAMPSNSGKSRFTIYLACYIAFVHKKKVLIISNEMSQEKMRLCMITTILNNPEIQKLHKQKLHKTEGELLELKFRPDSNKKVKCDDDGFILRKKDESTEDFIKRLEKNSKEFRQTIEITEWLNTQINNSIYFIHITEHTNDDLRKIIMNYYYKEAIEYIFYDTLKADTENIGNGNEIKKTATILSNLAQKFKIWIGSSMQLLESSTLPVNLTINDMSASKTVKEVLDTLCLIKQINRQTLKNYEYADTDQFEKCKDIKVPKDTDVRFYACVVDKNRAGAKPTLLFKLNLAYNEWEELGHLRLKQTEEEQEN